MAFKVMGAVAVGVLQLRYLLAQALPDGNIADLLDSGAAVAGLILAGFMIVWVVRGKLVPERLVDTIVAKTIKQLKQDGDL